MSPIAGLASAIRAISRRIRDDRGAILIFSALSLVGFMGFAAVAVDLAALFANHRQVQTVADVGALAGAQFADVSPDPNIAKQAVIDEVKAITATNLELADWNTCVDPDMPPEFAPLGGETPCISFTFGLTKIRVRVPDQTFDPKFGPIALPTRATCDPPVSRAGNTEPHRNDHDRVLDNCVLAQKALSTGVQTALPAAVPQGAHTML